MPVRQDDILEGTETFILNMMVFSSGEDTNLGKQSTAIVHIYDSTGQCHFIRAYLHECSINSCYYQFQSVDIQC